MAEFAKTRTDVRTFVDKKITTKKFKIRPEFLANHLVETKTRLVDKTP